MFPINSMVPYVPVKIKPTNESYLGNDFFPHKELDSELPKLANSCPDRGYKVAVFGLALKTQVFFIPGDEMIWKKQGYRFWLCRDWWMFCFLYNGLRSLLLMVPRLLCDIKVTSIGFVCRFYTDTDTQGLLPCMFKWFGDVNEFLLISIVSAYYLL